MTDKLKSIIANINMLTAEEKLNLLRHLVSSLENVLEPGAEDDWLALAEKRLDQLESGVVKGVSWQEVKAAVTG